jgi:putative redox protein
MSHVAQTRIGTQDYRTTIRVGSHELIVDEPPDKGGQDQGPKPTELVAAALGACTGITLRMYAGRKGWPLEGADVDVEVIEENGRRSLKRRVRLHGALSDEQRARLRQIADACPVHKMLALETAIETTVVD